MLLLCFINMFCKCFLMYLMISLYLPTSIHDLTIIFVHYYHILCYFCIFKAFVFTNYFIYHLFFCIYKVYILPFNPFQSISAPFFKLFYMYFTFIFRYSSQIFLLTAFFNYFFSYSLFTFINIFVIIISK